VQSKSIKLFLLSMVIVCVGTAMSPAGAGYVENYDSKIQTERNRVHNVQPIIVAGNPAVCKANYDQCLRGCNGFAQCNKQCEINYNGCLR